MTSNLRAFASVCVILGAACSPASVTDGTGGSSGSGKGGTGVDGSGGLGIGGLVSSGGTGAGGVQSGGSAGNGGFAAMAGGSAGLGGFAAMAGGSAGLGGSSGSANTGGGPGGVGGGPSVGGTGGVSSGGTSGIGGGTNDEFVLAWEDDFDTLNSSLWQLMTHSWDGNLAQFSTQNAAASSGTLSINLTPEPSDTAKPFRGVELRSVRTITYGKVEARVRFARGSGVVSGLVTIYTPWPADDWNEIDIEHLGRDSGSVQLNCMVYMGPPVTPPVTQSVVPTQFEQVVALGFDAETDFHVYTIEWTRQAVRFTVDGRLLRTWTTEIARMRLPQNILFTIWASNAAAWAGQIMTNSTPTSAEIDWIKVYDWQG